MHRVLGRYIASFFTVGDPEWAWRRRAALGAISLAFFMIIYAMLYEAKDNRFEKELDTSWLIISTVMTVYVGGAVMDKMNERKNYNPPQMRDGPESVVNVDTVNVRPADGGLADHGIGPRGMQPFPNHKGFN